MSGTGWPRELLENFRKNVKSKREGRGLSQGELAETVTEAGLPMLQQTVYRIESGSRAVKLEEAVALCDALGEPLSWFFEPPELTDLIEGLDEVESGRVNEAVVRQWDAQRSLARMADSFAQDEMLDDAISRRVHDALALTASGSQHRFIDRIDEEPPADESRRFYAHWLYCQHEALSPLPGYRLTAFEHDGQVRIGIAKVDPAADRDDLEQFGSKPISHEQLVGIVEEFTSLANEILNSQAAQRKHRGLLRWFRGEAE